MTKAHTLFNAIIQKIVYHIRLFKIMFDGVLMAIFEQIKKRINTNNKNVFIRYIEAFVCNIRYSICMTKNITQSITHMQLAYYQINHQNRHIMNVNNCTSYQSNDDLICFSI